MVLFDTRVGSYLPPQPAALIGHALAKGQSAGRARVIFAGETHTHPLHHLMQFELIKAVREMDGAPLAIGMEMFYRQHQSALDTFVFGDGSFSALKRRTQWSTTWGYDMNEYAKILNYARQNQIRCVGLNVPYRLVQMVATYGVAAIPPELRAYMPEMDLQNPRHRERFVGELERGTGSAAHRGISPQALGRSYEAMTLWDEYMAESIDNYMAKSESPSSRMVVLVGSSHVAGRDGVPDRYSRRSGEPTFSVVPHSVPWAKSGQPLVVAPYGEGEGDWILYTQEQIEQVARRSPLAARRSPQPASQTSSLREKPHISYGALRVGTAANRVFQM